MRLLVALRWLAVAGQILTIAVVVGWLRIDLPVTQMAVVILFLIGLNILSVRRVRSATPVTDPELFFALLFDVSALTAQLYLSGGATNPFAMLYLLQVILGAVLLRRQWAWILFGITSLCFLGLMRFYRDIGLLMTSDHHPWLSIIDLRADGYFICFVLASVLLIMALARINGNLRERDRRLSDLRQDLAEEEHILRVGLLASGAAHELGSPLATMSVLVNDWQGMPDIAGNPEMVSDIAAMQQAISRCKEIVSGVLMTAGETRGEEAERTTLVTFLDDVVAEWKLTKSPKQVRYVNKIGTDAPIVSDTVLQQALFNVFDNALEASPDWVEIIAARDRDTVSVTVRDHGPGISPQILAHFGRPYQTTKGARGRGLGLFLVVNVLRKIGGTVTPYNHRDGGAVLSLKFPLSALSLEGQDNDIG